MLLKQPPHPRPGKDGLGHDRAGQQEWQVQPHDRHQRQRRILQRVDEHDPPIRQPFGARRANIVLAETSSILERT